MATIGSFSYNHEAVRVKVKNVRGNSPADNRKFSIDPDITSFEILQSIIAKAFDIKGDFTLNYRAIDDLGQETFLPLLCDWDLDAAVLNASDPCLFIFIEVKLNEEKTWSSNEQADPVIAEIPRSSLSDTKPPNRLPGLIRNRVEKTFNIFQRAFNLVDEVATQPPITCRQPLSDTEFRKYLDSIGQISRMKELRSAIYFGGVEPSLRKVVWKHILNVYPCGMSGKERMDYMKRKTQEYENLRDVWRQCIVLGRVGDELAYVTSMVRKDVLRTDRHHKFYAGSDDNQNIAALFNILTTFAVNHPSVSYCQGMSDLASPLLVTMGDEAHAYICFCALMLRLKPNFMIDGETMTLKFQHLTEGLMQCDPQFYAYLKMHQAEDLLFCYRWLLLEMKREFAFDDALHMLEVLWSSLESFPPVDELPLFEVKFSSHASTPPISPMVRTTRENPYTKVCAIRRQSSSVSLNALSSARRAKTQRQNQSLDENVLERQNRLRKHGRLKPFFSLDDNCVDMLDSAVRNSQSTSAMNNCSEIDPLTLMKIRVSNMNLSNRSNALSSSTGNLIESVSKRTSNRRAVGEKSSSSLSKLGEKENEEVKTNKSHKGRTVKNLNEFLNLTGRGRALKPRQRSQCSSISEGDVFDGPCITVTRSGSEIDAAFDLDSDRSSCKQPSDGSSSISPNLYDRQPPSDESSPEPFALPPPPSLSDSSPDDSTDYCPVATSATQELRQELDNLDRQVLAQKPTCSIPEGEGFIWENPMPTTPDEQHDLEMDETTVEETNAPHAGEEAAEAPNFLTRSAMTTSNLLHSLRSTPMRSPTLCALPPPDEFGGGNPFLMFLCLTLLRQHRDFIMHNKMDYNEMAMHFDKMVRKHNVTRVLDEARQMFSSYIKQHSLQSTQNCKKAFKV